jgi:hypothetical protein
MAGTSVAMLTSRFNCPLTDAPVRELGSIENETSCHEYSAADAQTHEITPNWACI